MNVRIAQLLGINAGAWYDGQLEMNQYTIKLWMITQSINTDEQNVAFRRAKHFIHNQLENTIFVDAEDPKCKDFVQAGLNITTMPGDPSDQLIGIMLFHKLNAIMEGRIKITDMIMGSAMSEGVKYNTVSEVAEGAFSGNTWWNKSCTCMKNHEETTSDDNIVQLFDDSKWADMDLSWKEKSKK
jgi:hypothetical protein